MTTKLSDVFTLESLNNIAAFLQRVQLTGQEVPAFGDAAQRVINAGRALQAEQATPEQPATEPPAPARRSKRLSRS